MRKVFVCTLILACTFPFAYAQNSVTSFTSDCSNTPVSHWSVELKIGPDYFRANPAPPAEIDRIYLSEGGSVEYSINPLAGFGLEVFYTPYGGDITSTSNLDASTFDVSPYFSVNLSNLLSPYRTRFWKKINVFGESGAGISYYNFSLDNAPVKREMTVVTKFGINAEYNLTKCLALGLEGQYRYYDRAHMGGLFLAKGNGEAAALLVGLRYKFGSKNKQHARNISICDYKPRSVAVVDTKAMECCQDTKDQLKALEEVNAVLSQRLLNLEGEFKNLEDRLKLQSAQIDLKTPEANSDNVFRTIEYKFDSSNMTIFSFQILDNLVDELGNASWKKLKIIGNADSTGPAEYNQYLSEKRANAAKNFLINKNIPASKITTTGNGEEKPIATNETPEGRQKNRRVDFEIVK